MKKGMNTKALAEMKRVREYLMNSPAIPCSQCGARAVMPLSDEQLKEQPDRTSYVCHPYLGGCNVGFECEPDSTADTFARYARAVERAR